MGASLNDTFRTYYIMGASLNVARHNFRWIQLVCLVSVLGVAPGSSQTGLSLHSGWKGGDWIRLSWLGFLSSYTLQPTLTPGHLEYFNLKTKNTILGTLHLFILLPLKRGNSPFTFDSKMLLSILVKCKFSALFTCLSSFHSKGAILHLYMILKVT